MKLRLELLTQSKIIRLILPILICIAIVGEILPEDEAKFIVVPNLILLLLLSIISAIGIIIPRRSE